ncbi:SNF2 family N-terminal domain-containing protein [Chaetomium fimeti]|uniref:SNF2 family N-terminal domain-containing protein n=1 Tax=Chaetomium fimeti TaxID=1854472 RepID=A0AAE0HDB3_9PEZI|nr:SNF2 family N-terminal domain-containing protein [Chaetomium fimeti]
MMSAASTPKRRYESEDDDSVLSEGIDSFGPKRSRLQPPSTQQGSSWSRASSRSSGGRSPPPRARPPDVDDEGALGVAGTNHRHQRASEVLPTRLARPQITLQNSDLSNPDFTSIQEDGEVCFGMLKNIQVRLNRTLHACTTLTEIQGQDGTLFACFDLVIQEERCDIVAAGLPIGILNKKNHLALKSLAPRPLFKGMVPKQEFQQKLAAAELSRGMSLPYQSCTMAIVLSGPPSIAESLAKGLSKYHLFLQHPDPKLPGMEYQNPQYLTMVGSWLPNGAVLAPIAPEFFNKDTDRRDNADQEPENEVDLRTVMDNLPQPAYLREADIDGRIKTTLLKHQKEAVGFIISRETTLDSNLEGLWCLDNYVSGTTVYKHSITGFKSANPKDTLGGIVADGMGLGKTLTMIASIVATLPRANEFATGDLPKGDVKTNLTPVKATLVVVPSVLLLDGWIDEISKHVIPGTLECYRYHGPDRRLPSSGAIPYHVIISTYGTVAADFTRGGGVLRCFHWYRLVLDEAHVVRNRSTKQFSAVAALSAAHRWCMTGTPVQNSLDDLASLIRFLRVPQLEDAATFQKYITGRRTAGSNARPNYGNLKRLLGSICLRRSTSAILSSLGVAFIEHRPEFSTTERKAYDNLASSCKRSIQEAVNTRPTKKSSESILTAVLRLRIFCNTGLITTVVGNTNDDVEGVFRPDEVISLLLQSGEAICSQCKTDVMAPDVGHESQGQGEGSRRVLKCLACSQRDADTEETSGFSRLDDDPMEGVEMGGPGEQAAASTTCDDRPVDGRVQCPSKLIALLADVKEHYSEEKSIIFSFWRRSLDFVEKLFTEEGIVFGRVDGDVDPPRRRKILRDFHDDPSVKVLLMTIGTGAVGLNNLSVATRVHILEPQWNPYVEDQAIGRVVRMGQSKNVSVVRYMMKTSVEETIESRQMWKMQLALKGGLRSSDQEHSEIKRRIAHLQQFEKLIGSTILSQNVV